MMRVSIFFFHVVGILQRVILSSLFFFALKQRKEIFAGIPSTFLVFFSVHGKIDPSSSSKSYESHFCFSLKHIYSHFIDWRQGNEAQHTHSSDKTYFLFSWTKNKKMYEYDRFIHFLFPIRATRKATVQVWLDYFYLNSFNVPRGKYIGYLSILKQRKFFFHYKWCGWFIIALLSLPGWKLFRHVFEDLFSNGKFLFFITWGNIRDINIIK